MKGKLANGAYSQYPSHYLGTWCIQHYYRWCAHVGWRPSADLNGLARFARRRNLVSARVPSYFNWPLLMTCGLLHDAARVSDHRNVWLYIFFSNAYATVMYKGISNQHLGAGKRHKLAHSDPAPQTADLQTPQYYIHLSVVPAGHHTAHMLSYSPGKRRRMADRRQPGDHVVRRCED